MKVNGMQYGLPKSQLAILLRKRPFYILTKICTILFIWILLAIVVTQCSNLIIKMILWTIMGFFINGLIQLVHDAWHRNLFNTNWQNDLFGHAMSCLFPIMFVPARHAHMLHHRFNRTEKDPDAYNAGKRSWQLVLLYYAVIFFGLPLSIIHFNFLYPLRFYARPKLKIHFMMVALLACYYAILWVTIVRLDLTSLALTTWIIPFLFASPWSGFKSVADHYANDWRGNRFRTATTVRSNRFLTYFWNGLNYHLDHHLFPAIPGYHLSRVHTFTFDTLRQENALIFDSYLKVWWRSLRDGPVFVEDNVPFISISAAKSTS